LIISKNIFDEVARVLAYPKITKALDRKGVTIDLLKAFLNNLARTASITPGKLKVDVIKTDPSDNMILECAIEGTADYIVSGDQHLLELGIYKNIQIITPGFFLTIFK